LPSQISGVGTQGVGAGGLPLLQAARTSTASRDRWRRQSWVKGPLGRCDCRYGHRCTALAGHANETDSRPVARGTAGGFADLIEREQLDQMLVEGRSVGT